MVLSRENRGKILKKALTDLKRLGTRSKAINSELSGIKKDIRRIGSGIRCHTISQMRREVENKFRGA